MGKIEAIWIKRMKGGPMDPCQRVALAAGRGIEGNANQGGKRQITIISKESWSRLGEELGAEVDPEARRANFLVSGVELEESRGRLLSLGPVRIRIHGETRPCEQMDTARHGLKEALRSDWRGGVFGEVLDDGAVAIGDAVDWTPEE